MIVIEISKTVLLDNILEMADKLVRYETHSDEVARWYGVQQQINRRIEQKMIEIRKKEKDE